MVTIYRYVPKHKNGHFINIYAEPVADFMKAAKFHDEDELAFFLTGRYGPDDPQNFRAFPIQITYEPGVGPDGPEGDNEVPTSSISTRRD